MPIVMIDSPRGTYWSQWDRYVHDVILAQKLISEEDLALYKVTNSAKEAADEITRFYSNFHSIRYHRDDLIIRMQQAPTAAQLQRLDRDFVDIQVSGSMQLSGPLDVEKDEPDLKHLHRLVFRFNKRNQGRLRVLINRINDLVA